MSRASNTSQSSSHQSSSTRSSESRSLPASASGSAGRGRGTSGSLASGSPQQQSGSGYVSPYPPLPAPGAAPTARAISAITGTQGSQTRARRTSTTTSETSSDDESQPSSDYSSAESPRPRPQQRTSGTMLDARTITAAQKQALITALNEHRINTIGELRRVERIFAQLGSSDLTQPMTAAWVYYVNSNSLLTEMRGLTRNYPFSSELLDEARRRVHQDPSSNRSWNYCWLVLAKVHTDRLISTYARAQASRPEMWGGRIPLADSVNQLSEAFITEWTAALAQLLRYWESPPIR